MRRTGLAGLIAYAVVFAAQPVRAAETVAVRGGVHPGYGRIVFDWPAGVGFSASVSNRMLNVRFDRALDPDFGTVRTVLRRYLRDIRLASDGRTVLAGLSNEFEVKTMTAGNRVVIDLTPKAPSPAGEEGPPPAEKQAAGARQPVKPPIRLGPRRAPTQVRETVQQTVPQEAQEAQREAAVEPKTTAARDGSASARLLRVRTGHRADYGRLVFDWSSKVGFTVDRQGQAIRMQFDAPGQIDSAALRDSLPSQIRAVLARNVDNRLELSFVVMADAQLRYFHNGASVVFDVVAPGARRAAEEPKPRERKSKAASSRVDGETEKTKRRTSRKKKRDEVRPLTLVSVEATRRGAEAVIRFNWRRPVGAAVFQRNGALWIVFDRAARIDLGAIEVVGSALFQSVEQEIGENHVQIRLPFGAGLNAAIERDGDAWVLAAGPRQARAPKPLDLELRRSTDYGQELMIRTPEPGRIIVSTDRTVGDSAYAVPLKAPGVGIPGLFRFPEFELAPSAQGVAIRPLDESVRVRAEKDGVVVFRKGGLTISPDFEKQVAAAKAGGGRKLLDLDAWRYGADEDFQKVEHQLLQFLSQPRGVRRNAARIGLARFYVAHGLGSEALGVIAALLRDDPGILRDSSVRAMRGLANYLIGHYPEAEKDLAHSSLAGVREIYPWRAAIAAARGDWAGAKRLFEDTDTIIASQPPQFAIHLGVLAAEAALSVDDTGSAEARLGALQGLSASGSELDRIAYLKGHVHKQRNRPAKALEIWKSVMEYGDRPSRAKAAFAAVNLRLEQETIANKDAIEELEKLKFAWRNSVFEFDLLHKLGDLYASEAMLRDALVTLRKAASLYRNIKGAQAVTEKMRQLFRRFYLDGEADKLKPVVALGLFNEFRELTPPADEGDLMIRHLAERLVKVDLLDDAAKLYEHQIRFRVKGPQKAEIGTRLADIRLMNNEPDNAVMALDLSKVDKVDAALEERRRFLRARALNESGRAVEALKVIEDDYTDRFDLLRAEIHWRSGDWYKASRMLALISSRYDPAGLGNDDVEILLRRAVALGLAGDREGMDFLRERFGTAMEKSHRAAAFKAVAGGVDRDVQDFAALARQAAELETFRGFLESLDNKPGTEGAKTAGAGGAS